MDVSNKSMAFLLLVAVAVSFLSTTVSLDRLGKLEMHSPTVQALSDTGAANLTIIALVSVNFDVDTINFGTGYIIGGSGNCELNTNGTSNSSPNDQCSGFNMSTTPFVINNTGNVDAKLELQSDNDASGFTGGTAELQWWMDENEAGACTSQNVIFDDWQDINTTIYTVCDTGGFESDFGADTINLHMRVLVPDDATLVGSERTVTITGTVS